MTAVMILAAGLGTRLRPFTHHHPKCLYPIQGVPLLGHHLQKLAEAGCRRVVINIAHLADQVRTYAGDGSRWGLHILYSQESPDNLLGTGGALKPVLKYFQGESGLLLISADIFSACDYKPLLDYASCSRGAQQSRLLVVKPPNWASKPDFYWDKASGRLDLEAVEGYEPVVFTGIGCLPLYPWYQIKPRRFGLNKIIAVLCAQNALYGQWCQDLWQNVGCLQRVEELQCSLSRVESD